MAIRIGCGSWNDSPYARLFRSRTQPDDSPLQAYTRWFDRIELNVTYHSLQPRERIADWVRQTPAGFLFDVKLLKDFSSNPRAAATPLADRFLASIEPIVAAAKLGAFLLTLAPSFGPKRHRLDELDAVAGKFSPLAPVAVELRDRAWIEGDALSTTLAFFRERRFAWVALDLPRISAPAILPPIDEVTHPSLAYMRLHGRNPDYAKVKIARERHNYAYPDAELGEIAARIRSLAARVANVHVSANNHYRDFAPKTALALRHSLGESVPASFPGTTDDQLSFLT
ncbi:MAG TPA: DUF72 domain-containing protein [Opitutus sp.]|nr:DUF72 domain-containing protein [Opitutus sp.]